jgi:hypothetical protein
MFKKGDIVECVYAKDDWSIKVGKTYEVLRTYPNNEWVEIFLPQAGSPSYYYSSRFKLVETKMSDLQKKREELEKAIEVIRSTDMKWVFYSDKSIYYYRTKYATPTCVFSKTVLSEVSKNIFPDPKQKEIERIELEMRKLADDLAKLKG